MHVVGIEQCLSYCEVGRERDLEVALAACDSPHGDIRQVPKYNAAVIGSRDCGERGVGIGEPVRLSYDREPETLRGLAPT
jgi:hypothetical protein